MSIDSDVTVALDAIERYESRFLTWGILDRTLTRHAIEQFIAPHVDGAPHDVIDELERRKLLFEVPRTTPLAYRSRMAEGVRLFAYLRQQFDGRPWESAARLVADFRFLVRPRQFPARVFDRHEVEERLGGPAASPQARRALSALLEGDSEEHARWLSRFQVEASAEILRGLSSTHDLGCIVTAGSGSGKTLAFYLPTLLHLVTDPDRGKGTRVLAVYPRNELLKDQLLATLREVRRIRAADASLPAIRIGAYFGQTPLGGGSMPLPPYLGWHQIRRSGASICAFLVCPGLPGGKECGASLQWSDEDRRANRSRLTCGTCGAEVNGVELALTRMEMQDAPPDIVFTTTEMLNRSLADDWSCHVFGVGPRAKVHTRLVLLDESHTYSGSSGAQAAYVLRRWRQLAGGPVMWVGLSATLRDAEQFFARLSGVSADFVREVTPLGDDLEHRGHEYQLLLRGDPTSQRALLSTSIQSLMLLIRLLDPLGTAPSLGAYGNKVFAFCDNLDLTNRLFRQLLDAEGRDPVGKPDPRKHGSLALLRSQRHHPRGNAIVDWPDRDRNGQEWWLVDRLRESPTPPMIGRTSSQDTGVTAQAETVVATASLEVGFDDPAVGAVLQHKAPRDMAQFLQRRGRAGRSLSMRPWTVVVLSDYGRDRVAYQSYERLFDPTLPAKSLPLGNRSIQRIQATFAVMDWVAERLRATHASVDRGSVREDLSTPQSGRRRERQEAVAAVLNEVLEREDRRVELSAFLQRSLRLSAEEIEILLWEGPRSVLLEAIPTALRRLESNWHAVRGNTAFPAGDRQRKSHPLPEFVPANLFSDLCLPEIEIVAPENYDEAAETEEPVFLALNELAPGNVTLRYAVWKTRGLWVDPRTADGRLDVATTFLQGGETIAHVKTGAGEQVDVVRPFSIHATIPDHAVRSTSSGRFIWHMRASPIREAIEGELPTLGTWSAIIDRAEFLLQAGRGGLHLLRYTLAGTAEVGFEHGGQSRITYELARGDEPVAVGVEIDVDAMRVRITPPTDVSRFSLDRDPRRLRQLRREYFLWLVEEALGGAAGLNPFLAAWTGELTLAAIAFFFVDQGVRPVVLSSWTSHDWHDRLLETFDRVFSGLHDVHAAAGTPPLRDAIELAIGNEAVCRTLARLYEQAAASPDSEWNSWLRSRFAVTAAAGIHAAIQALLPDFDADTDLTVDLVDAEAFVDIWICDTAVGGGGLIEALYAAYAEDPRRFWNLALGALEPQETEQVADHLQHVVVGLAAGTLASPAQRYRGASDNEEALRAWRDLMRAISQTGIPPAHTLAVALATRIIRPGSSAESDRAVFQALQTWGAIEEDLGFALDQRTACALLSVNQDMVAALRRAAPADVRADGATWAFNVLLGLLWPSPEESRGHALQPPMPFTDRPPLAERTLVLDALAEHAAVIDVTAGDWRSRVDAILAATGRCVVRTPVGGESRLHDVLIQLMVEPLEVGSLHLHPRIVGMRRRQESVEFVLELIEAPQ